MRTVHGTPSKPYTDRICIIERFFWPWIYESGVRTTRDRGRNTWKNLIFTLVFWPGFEPGTRGVRVRALIHGTNRFPYKECLVKGLHHPEIFENSIKRKIKILIVWTFKKIWSRNRRLSRQGMRQISNVFYCWSRVKTLNAFILKRHFSHLREI